MLTFNTYVGTNVQIWPLPDVSLFFEEVTIAGNTTASVSATAPAPVPSHYDVISDNYYDISTTATHIGLTSVGITYDGSGLTE